MNKKVRHLERINDDLNDNIKSRFLFDIQLCSLFFAKRDFLLNIVIKFESEKQRSIDIESCKNDERKFEIDKRFIIILQILY